MSPGEAGAALRIAVTNEIQKVNQKALARAPRAVNAIRNAELKVLSGNSSPSPPGSPPGRRTGHLRLAWTGGYDSWSFGGTGVLIRVWQESGSHYAGYLEKGTRKMDARPFVDKIKVVAAPKIVAIYSSM